MSDEPRDPKRMRRIWTAADAHLRCPSSLYGTRCDFAAGHSGDHEARPGLSDDDLMTWSHDGVAER